MVLAAIAQGLSPQISNTVLTRRLHDTPAREEYEYLSVQRFWNPSPAVWKDYATGVHHVSFWKRCIVTGIDVVCSLEPLRRLMRESDLVHLHFPLPLGLSVLIVRTLVKRPLVVTVHGNADVYELPRALEPVTRAVLTRADAVVSVSEDLGDYLRNVMGVPHVTVIPNGVDVDEFHPGHRVRARLLTLFSISRLVPRKNIHVLIAAVEQLVKEGAAAVPRHRRHRPGRGTDQRLRRATRAGRCASSASSTRLASARSCPKPTCSCSCRRAKACRSPRWRRSRPAFRVSCPIFPGCASRLRPDRRDGTWTIRRTCRAWSRRCGRCWPIGTARGDETRPAAPWPYERYSLQAMCESYWNVFTDLAEGRGRDRRRRSRARTVLVTGAAGFIGSALVRSGSRRGASRWSPTTTCRAAAASILPRGHVTAASRATSVTARRLHGGSWPPAGPIA